MLQGQKIIAFTPCGRKRYMDINAAYVKREHERGHIDEWVLFNNAYSLEDATYADQIREGFGDWVKVLQPVERGKPERIASFFKHMKEAEGVIYLRLDDDIVYIEETAVPRIVDFRLKNPEAFLVYPVILNNVRTSYHLQRAGIVDASWGIKNEMCDVVAWKHQDYIYFLHMKILDAIERGTLIEDFALPSEVYSDPTYEDGHISINVFAMWGTDLVACDVAPDEESYLSVWRPKELGKQNARAGDSMFVHFAYHTQTAYMDSTGMLGDYTKLAPPLGFRTKREAPPKAPPEPQQQRRVHQRPTFSQFDHLRRAHAAGQHPAIRPVRPAIQRRAHLPNQMPQRRLTVSDAAGDE